MHPSRGSLPARSTTNIRVSKIRAPPPAPSILSSSVTDLPRSAVRLPGAASGPEASRSRAFLPIASRPARSLYAWLEYRIRPSRSWTKTTAGMWSRNAEKRLWLSLSASSALRRSVSSAVRLALSRRVRRSARINTRQKIATNSVKNSAESRNSAARRLNGASAVDVRSDTATISGKSGSAR